MSADVTPLTETGQRFRCGECGAEQVPDDCGHRTLTGERLLVIEDDYLTDLATAIEVLDAARTDSLAVAWAAAEAALPGDAWVMGLRIGLGMYVAEAWSTDDGESITELDPDPVVALAALRAALDR